jgi:drug/metabolite transporter (DMT)-like permease
MTAGAVAQVPGPVLAAVMFAALMHASWNALVKSNSDTFLATVLVAAAGGLVGALALPFLAPPDPASWSFIIASSLVHILSYLLLVETFREGDISHAYPLMRGCAPLLVALASGPLTGERLTALQWCAIVLICGGVLTLYASARAASVSARRTTLYALATAGVIACYTMIDGAGVRRSGSPAAYTIWMFMLTGLGVLALGMRRRPGQVLPFARRHAALALAGGAATLGSYGIALWAMTLAPVAVVAALRETSILFATAIAALVLRERVGLARVAAAALVACGAAAMRL